jgi:hypothetical protein
VSSATYTGISILKLIIAVSDDGLFGLEAETQILIEARGCLAATEMMCRSPQMMVALEWSLTDQPRPLFALQSRGLIFLE